MKKLNFFYLLTLLLVFASCSSSSDDDSRNEVSLSVSVNNLLLEAAEGSYTEQFSIISSVDWKIVSYADWLDFTATEGIAGSVTIRVRAKSTNDSSEERIGEFDVKAGDKVKTVTVRQLSALAEGCVARPTNLVILTDGIAFDFNFGRNVSYYYYGFMDKASIGSMTDDEIAEICQETFWRYTPEEEAIGYLSGLTPNTEYYLITFAYDKKGKRGELIKTLVKTRPIVNSRPRVWITDISYDATKWSWTTTMSAYTSKYYMSYYTGENAYYASEIPTVWIAWYMKNHIDNGDYAPILQSGNWSADRVENDGAIYVYAWAVGENNTFAYQLDTLYESFIYSPTYSKASNDAPQAGVISKEQLSEYMKGCVLVEE